MIPTLRSQLSLFHFFILESSLPLSLSHPVCSSLYLPEHAPRTLKKYFDLVVEYYFYALVIDKDNIISEYTPLILEPVACNFASNWLLNRCVRLHASVSPCHACLCFPLSLTCAVVLCACASFPDKIFTSVTTSPRKKQHIRGIDAKKTGGPCCV